MKMKSVIAGAFLVATLPLSAIADEKKAAGSGPNPFSDCGIGAALFPKHKVAAVTSNIIWDVGTTALTSATASPETCSGKEVTAAKFILDSYEQLAEETARGQGTHLNALMNIMEVKTENRSSVILSIRQQMSGNVSQADYSSQNKVEKSSNYYLTVVSAIDAA